jgi:hypothetical protein
MDTDRKDVVGEVIRRETWRQTAPLLADSLVPFVVAPDETDWATGISLEDSDHAKSAFYEYLNAAEAADDGKSDSLAIVWGGGKSQFPRLRRLIGEVGGAVGLAVLGEGVLRLRSEMVSRKVKAIYDHFGTLDIYGLEQPGGVTIFPDPNLEGWWEMTVAGPEWVAALRRVG